MPEEATRHLRVPDFDEDLAMARALVHLELVWEDEVRLLEHSAATLRKEKEALSEEKEAMRVLVETLKAQAKEERCAAESVSRSEHEVIHELSESLREKRIEVERLTAELAADALSACIGDTASLLGPLSAPAG